MHLHRWLVVERIGSVVTETCTRCGRTRTRRRGPQIDSPDPRNPRHQDRPENAAAANTGPRNAITAAVAVQHRTANPYNLWIADNASPDYHG
jgi:hypothetical protein